MRMPWLFRNCHLQTPSFDHGINLFVKYVLGISLELSGEFFDTPVPRSAKYFDNILNRVDWRPTFQL